MNKLEATFDDSSWLEASFYKNKEERRKWKKKNTITKHWYKRTTSNALSKERMRELWKLKE